jgi:hypothetical protein
MIRSRLRRAWCGRRQAEMARIGRHILGSIGSDRDQRVALRIAASGLDQQPVQGFIAVSHPRQRLPTPRGPRVDPDGRTFTIGQTALMADATLLVPGIRAE